MIIHFQPPPPPNHGQGHQPLDQAAKLWGEGFRLDNRNNLFPIGVVLQWHRLPGGVMGSLHLEVFQSCGDVGSQRSFQP